MKCVIFVHFLSEKVIPVSKKLSRQFDSWVKCIYLFEEFPPCLCYTRRTRRQYIFSTLAIFLFLQLYLSISLSVFAMKILAKATAMFAPMTVP